MAQISVKLPDGQERQLPAGASSLMLAESISPSLAKRMVVALVNGEITDLQDPLKNNDQVFLLDTKSEYAQDVISHSCEHVLAAAVIELFPGAQVTMGPKDHKEGFYYDFDVGRPFTDEDVVLIEEKMHELIKQNISFTKRWMSKIKAKELFIQLKQKYKPEILDWIVSDTVTLYQSGNFIDLCRGPHLPSAGFIKAFKLTGVSGSYWRNDASREMLQRISGIAFAQQKELDEYLFRIEEAKKRDHRKLGPQHDLFFVSEKFDSWSDTQATDSEARAVIYIPAENMNNLLVSSVSEIEKLFSSIRQALPSKKLLVRSVNTNPGSGENQKAWADVRLFAGSQDSASRKDIYALVNNFSKNSALEIKFLFEAQAVEDIGPGLVMWLPQGGRLRSLVEDFSRQRHFAGGYDMVYSPHIAKSDLWRISGHLGFYRESMFAPMNVDGAEYMLKPMNCPFHALMFKFKRRSYRDLPLRFAEFGTVYRYEMAGVLHGLMRVRGFTQDDAHIFCRWDQLDSELDQVLEFVTSMLKAFGFSDFELNISTRPQKYVGVLGDWDRAEQSLKLAVERTGLSYKIDEGGGAFYGPKIDLKLKDCLGRLWQCSTVQLDFNNPERFNLEFINNTGAKERPVMLHRALFGSIERFLGILIEHYAGAFPAWLSPEQVRILTVSDRHNEHGEHVLRALSASGIRAEFKPSSEKLGAKIREAQIDKIPLMIIIGDKEVAEEGGTLRLRSQEDKGFFKLPELIKIISQEVEMPKR
jgi:threonyl-tRNA synthetase